MAVLLAARPSLSDAPNKPEQAQTGLRVELDPGEDRWMMGDRYGTIREISVEDPRVPGLLIELDKSGLSLWYSPTRIMPMQGKH